MGRRLTPEQELNVVRDYTTPLPDGTWIGADTIAARYGIVPQTVPNILARHGIKRRTSKEAYANGKRCKPITSFPPEGVEPPLCKCGCGGHVPWRKSNNRWDTYCPGHYHPHKPHRDREWLYNAYCVENKTTTEIAAICGVHPGSVLSMMKKFGIPRRNMSDAHIGRQAGENNPAWKGGVTPERQQAYKTQEWKRLCRAVDKRDGLKCQRCGAQCGRYTIRPHRHHIKPWADYPELRLDPANVVTLCDACHVWVHSLDNVNKEWLG